MTYTRDQVVERALASLTNKAGFCYQWTRTVIGSAGVGDVDGDGDADAVDGWKAAQHRHAGDRNPPAGVPVFWSGGSGGFGHAAVSLGGGRIRSTDAGGKGKVATVELDWVERAWGLRYLGWSEDLNGDVIPDPPSKAELEATAERSLTRRIRRLLRIIRRTPAGPRRRRLRKRVRLLRSRR